MNWLENFAYWVALLPSKFLFWMTVVTHPELSIVIDNTPSMYFISDWFMDWCRSTGVKYRVVNNPFESLELKDCIFVTDGCFFMVQARNSIVINVLEAKWILKS